jgi:carbonic anhydrase
MTKDKALKALFNHNKEWAQAIKKSDANFFEKLSRKHAPKYLWIGCSDSRVPANQIVGLLPGEVFVHRNVANVVVHTDLNCLSVIQFAIEILKIKHIIVCGHYGCGGVQATLEKRRHGLIDNWLRHVQDVHHKHAEIFNKLTQKRHWDALCELNVVEQAMNVCLTTIVQDAWQRGQEVYVHGWIYDLHDGLLRDLGLCIGKNTDIPPSYNQAIKVVKSHNRFK